MRINGAGVFLLALACGAVAHLLVPDQLMTPWGVRLSPAQTTVACIYAILCAGLLWTCMRAPFSAELAPFWAGLCVVALLALVQGLRNGEWAVGPALAIAVGLCGLAMLNRRWLRRARAAKP